MKKLNFNKNSLIDYFDSKEHLPEEVLPQLVEDYATLEKIKCPKCGWRLFARVDKKEKSKSISAYRALQRAGGLDYSLPNGDKDDYED